MSTERRPYLRPPKKQTTSNKTPDTPLGAHRKALVEEWTVHAMEEHGYPSDRGAAMRTFKCFLCQQYIRELHATEKSDYVI